MCFCRIYMSREAPQCEKTPSLWWTFARSDRGRMASRRGSRRAYFTHSPSFDAVLADHAPAWTTSASKFCALKQGYSDRAGYLTQAQGWTLSDELLFCTVSDGHMYATRCRVFLVHMSQKANVMILTSHAITHTHFRA